MSIIQFSHIDWDALVWRSAKSVFLTPRVLTIKTLWLVNTKYLTALRAYPPFFFVSDEMPYADFSNAFEIDDHAHAILGSIPLIQMIQPDARETVTIKAVLGFGVRHLLTVLDFTFNAGFRFEAVVTPATGAWFLISGECSAEAAIHSTGSDQLCGNRGCLCQSF
jgi:hypothetical protein